MKHLRLFEGYSSLISKVSTDDYYPEVIDMSYRTITRVLSIIGIDYYSDHLDINRYNNLKYISYSYDNGDYLELDIFQLSDEYFLVKFYTCNKHNNIKGVYRVDSEDGLKEIINLKLSNLSSSGVTSDLHNSTLFELLSENK